MKARKQNSGTAAALQKPKDIFFEKVAAGLILITIFLSIFNQGLLYERQILPVLILVSLLSLVVILRQALSRKLSIRFYEVPLAMLLFCLAAGLSVFGAVLQRSAVYTLSKYVSFLLLTLALAYLKNYINLKQWIIKAFAVSALAFAILGLDAIWGEHIIALVNRFFNGGQLPPAGEGFFFSMVVDQRLSAVFQYPNTTATYLFCGWLAALSLVLESAQLQQKRETVFYGTVAFFCFYAFILTISRGAFLVAGMLILVLLVLTPRQKLPHLLSILFVIAAPAGILGLLSFPGAPLRGLGALPYWLILLLCGTVFGFLGQRLLFHLSSISEEGTVWKLRWNRNWWIAALCLCILLLGGAGFIWFSNLPYELNSMHTPLLRLFNVDDGKYTLKVEFGQPLQGEADQADIIIQSQSRQEMILEQRPEVLHSSTMDYVGETTLLLPFEIKDGFSQRLIIDGSNATGTNSVTKVEVLNEQNDVAETLRLARPLLSESAVQSIQNIFYTRTAYTRFSFYLDAWEIFRDHPVTGIGGGGWENIYGQYQKYYYVSNDAHSYGVQVIVEEGIPGLLALISIAVLFILALRTAWHKRQREQQTLLLMAAAIFAHSMIDVDLAFFGYFLVFCLILSSLDYRTERKEIPALENRNLCRSILAVGALLGAVFAIFLPWRIYTASLNAERYAFASQANEADAALYYIEKAAGQDPFRSEYKASLAQELVLQEHLTATDLERSQQMAEQAYIQGSYSRDTLSILKYYYFSLGQFDKADEMARCIIEQKPLYMNLWHDRAALIEEILQNLTEEEQREERIHWLETGLGIPEEMRQASEGKWTELAADGTIQGYLDRWQQELERLLAE